MNIKLVVMMWVKGNPIAHEIVELNEERLLDILRGAQPLPFDTPVKKQDHWELREANFR